MATFTDRSFDDRRRAHRPGRGYAALPVLLLLALALVPQFAAAQAGERAELRRAVEQRYEVLPIRDGVLLKPRVERLGVRSIEVAGDTLAVNGERLSAEVLRAWLAEEAEPILRLHRLPARERRALFGLPADGGAAAVPAGAGRGAPRVDRGPRRGGAARRPPAAAAVRCRNPRRRRTSPTCRSSAPARG